MKTPTEAMLLAMLALQERMNRKIDPAWLSAGHAFLRAVLVEAVEGLEHFGWKWWKRQEPNLEQLRIELVDIWHFLLSHYLVAAGGVQPKAAERIAAEWQGPARILFDGASYDIPSLDLRAKLELLAALSAVRKVSLPLFSSLLWDCGIDAERLYRDYVSKNVLNHFRQDNGYKAGTYRKMWQGREDNEHMAEILAHLAPSPGLADELYRELERKYHSLQ
ncbi:MAG TPA: dUTP diphosphatase [Burkholderiales bacterium]|nr:dUTP diphosphatase [Burkholderiales bacterium]